MSTNAIDISHNSEHLATKADVAEIKGEIRAMSAEFRAQIKLLIGLVSGLYIGLALLFVDKLAG